MPQTKRLESFAVNCKSHPGFFVHGTTFCYDGNMQKESSSFDVSKRPQR